MRTHKVCYHSVMTEYYTQTLERLHEELAAIYRRSRGGAPLTPTENVTVDGLWARIERIETAAVLIAAREQEGIQ